jgi:hypothetical protein
MKKFSLILVISMISLNVFSQNTEKKLAQIPSVDQKQLKVKHLTVVRLKTMENRSSLVFGLPGVNHVAKSLTQLQKYMLTGKKKLVLN